MHGKNYVHNPEVYILIHSHIHSVDGQWTDWNNWTECSVSCDNGTHHRKRSCSNPLPDNGGEYCNGDDIQIDSCILEPCRGIKIVLV